MELRAIVCGEGLNSFSMTFDYLEQPGVDLVDGSRLELANEGVSGLSFNQGDDTVLAAFARHCVDLPVTEGFPWFQHP